MGYTSEYVFRNWRNVASYTVIPIAECLQGLENIQTKGNFFLGGRILLSSMFMVLCTKCT